jgi:multiple sugar transport system ATP-binding protein
VAVEVKLVEPLGSDTLIHFDVAGASSIARVDPSLKAKVGERMFLKPRADKIHLFDRETGRVLP